jgi:hypothetical protein
VLSGQRIHHQPGHRNERGPEKNLSSLFFPVRISTSPANPASHNRFASAASSPALTLLGNPCARALQGRAGLLSFIGRGHTALPSR